MKNSFKDYISNKTNELFSHFDSTHNKYESIWKIYNRQMPNCTKKCSSERDKYSEEVWLDGPQGIYWIGKKPKILFVGREHFGWFGETTWENGKESICYAPLEFAFYTISSMGTYWAVLKELISEVLGLDLGDWETVLKNVAFTNACKCLTNNRTLQWRLHQECISQSYLLHEISAVAAPVNVLFTRSIDLSNSIFNDNPMILENDDEFLIKKIEAQIIIECSHPGRQSREWRERLKNVIAKWIEVTKHEH